MSNKSLWNWKVFLVGGALLVGLFVGSSYNSQNSPIPLSNLSSKIAFRPLCEFTIEREGYDLVYDGQHRQARLVHQYLTKEKLDVDGASPRSAFSFAPDPSVPGIIRVAPKDYQGTGFDRGHLCPSADAKLNNKEQKETFYMSNVSPQLPQFNRRHWKFLENHVRRMAQKYKAIHVFTGPLYLPHEEADSKKYVKYQVIEIENVAVPTHFFKAIFNDQWVVLECYVLPNEEIPSSVSFDKFKTTIEKIEKDSGIVFSSVRGVF